jgi:two-component system response regulator GlrR
VLQEDILPGILGKILIVDDDVTLRMLLSTLLKASNFHADAVADLDEMRKAIRRRTYDAVLLDLMLGDEESLSAIPVLVSEAPHTKIIMMSAHGTIEVAVDAMEKGAAAFISKGKEPDKIIAELKKRLAKPKALASPQNNYGIIGCSKAIRDVVEKMQVFSTVDTPLFISGEVGTGKEHTAKAIHLASRAHQGRFEAINCGSFSDDALEEELFGTKAQLGLFETCFEGTLLLNEIETLSTNLQERLLRVLKHKELRSSTIERQVEANTRLISSSQHDLSVLKTSGKLKMEFLDEISVLKIELRPLRECREDILLLAHHFVDFYSQKFGKKISPLSLEIDARLRNNSWPGNVQELKHAIERAVILSTDDRLAIDDIFPEGTSSSGTNKKAATNSYEKSLSEAKQDFERKYLQHLLESTRGNISEMARISGRYRTDIYRLLTKHGVVWEEFRPEHFTENND